MVLSSLRWQGGNFFGIHCGCNLALGRRLYPQGTPQKVIGCLVGRTTYVPQKRVTCPVYEGHCEVSFW